MLIYDSAIVDRQLDLRDIFRVISQCALFSSVRTTIY